MSDTTLDSTLAYAQVRHVARENPKWSRRQTLLFVIGTSTALWAVIGLTLTRLF